MNPHDSLVSARRFAFTATGLLAAGVAQADEGGVSFWLPGEFGSFTATPVAPGWSLPVLTYYSKVEENADKTFLRGGRVAAGVDANVALLFLSPTYTLSGTVLGGQAAVSIG